MAVSLGGANRIPGAPFGLSWKRGKRFRTIAIIAAFAAALSLTLPAAYPASAAPAPLVPVIVREIPGSGDAAELLVERLGGTVGDRLAVIDGFTAEIPAATLASLNAEPSILSVTPDTKVRLLDWDKEWDGEEGDKFRNRAEYDDDAYYDDDDVDAELNVADTIAGSAYQRAPSGWMALVNDATGAMDFWAKGFTGAGVDVALIDSGIAPVDGINLAGKVVNGLDISFESQADNLRYLDTYGHGTHMAGIIAGRDTLNDPVVAQQNGEFVGTAPGARILNIKVADANGAVDVSQVIAAIDWVVQHRNDNGLNIRVLNLSFGTDGTQPYALDPLVYAVQMAWNRGIVVVVAAGNDGNWTALRNPALNPYVIAVGASDTRGTERVWDDYVTDFSNCGNADRSVDIVAPGKSIESLRVPGSSADKDYPSAVVGTRFFKGSGTSQAAAVVSGAAALIIDQRPNITPDQLKALLMKSARPLKYSSSRCQGDGGLNLGKALKMNTPAALQVHPVPTGTGLLDLARGSAHLVDGTVVLDGEQDIFGLKFDSASWSTAAAQRASWSGGVWNGSSWSGASWSSKSWSGASWSSASWSSASWSGASWSSASWSSASWSGASWSSASWSGASWSSASWSSNVWSSKSWGGVFTAMANSWMYPIQ